MVVQSKSLVPYNVGDVKTTTTDSAVPPRVASFRLSLVLHFHVLVLPMDRSIVGDVRGHRKITDSVLLLLAPLSTSHSVQTMVVHEQATMKSPVGGAIFFPNPVLQSNYSLMFHSATFTDVDWVQMALPHAGDVRKVPKQSLVSVSQYREPFPSSVPEPVILAL